VVRPRLFVSHSTGGGGAWDFPVSAAVSFTQLKWFGDVSLPIICPNIRRQSKWRQRALIFPSLGVIAGRRNIIMFSPPRAVCANEQVRSQQASSANSEQEPGHGRVPHNIGVERRE